jgi:N-succinyldiaminopimelate aminotransferase
MTSPDTVGPTEERSSYLASRAAAFGETVFSEFSALAVAHGAVNLGQGFPDFAPPDFVVQALRSAIEGDHHQYARGSGLLALAETLAAQLERPLGRTVDPLDEVTVTVGATEALFATTLALVEPGDEVILFEPFYDSYPADVAIAGGQMRFVPLQPGTDGRWGFDPDELRQAFSRRTKLIFVNTPHNPTGKVFTEEELGFIAGLCLEHDTIAVCDEVYEHIVFDGASHACLAALPGMADRTVTIGSAGKTFSVTGWKIGWTVACPALSSGIRNLHQWIPFAVATPLQVAVRRALEEAPTRDYYSWLRRVYQDKRDRLASILRQAGLTPYLPEGTYFIVADTTALGFEDDVAFCRHLTTQVGVAAIPPSFFYSEAHRHLARHHARFCFCKRDETLQAAAERLSVMHRR